MRVTNGSELRSDYGGVPIDTCMDTGFIHTDNSDENVTRSWHVVCSSSTSSIARRNQLMLSLKLELDDPLTSGYEPMELMSASSSERGLCLHLSLCT